jgi:hypothetical protein
MTLADTPWPRDSGKRVRQWANLRALAELGEVDALVLFSSMDPPQAPPGVHLHGFQHVGPEELPALKAIPGLALGRPWSVARKPWGQVRELLAARLWQDYDLVWFGALDHALELRDAIRSANVVVDIDDIETEKVRAFLRLPIERSAAGVLTAVQRRIELPMWVRIQRRVLALADRVIVCSEEDARLLDSGRAAVIPNCFPGPAELPEAGDRQRGALLLIGNYAYEPNVDAAQFAAREVLPLVRRQVPDAQLRLVGRASREALSDLADCPGVVLVGPVPDTAPELISAAAVLVPVRWGGGTRVKVAEAFAYGAPVVSTSLGCAGYPVESGRELLINDDAEGFAASCVAILAEPALGTRLADAGRALYERLYTPEAIASRVAELVASISARP